MLGFLTLMRTWWRALRDPASPRWLRWLPLFALGYALLPFDGLPDLLPLVGQLDDLTVIAVAAGLLHKLIPADAWARAKQAVDVLEKRIIDVTPVTVRPSPPPATTPAADTPEARTPPAPASR
jgi:uncharacterized membrane protein YkvA (DUF1232 family)